jgi:hypothetical protein
MVQGRSKQVFKAWLGERDTSWRDGIEVVAMDGFTGFKTATNEELPDAVAVMDPFHVVRLAGDALDQCRRRVQQATVQQATCGHRGRKGDPLYCRAAHPAHRIRPAHRQATPTADRAVRRRRACRGRSDLTNYIARSLLERREIRELWLWLAANDGASTDDLADQYGNGRSKDATLKQLRRLEEQELVDSIGTPTKGRPVCWQVVRR